MLVHGGIYYLYGTRGATCWGPADGFDVYTGKDLRTWEGPAVCFQNDGTFWADRNYWAPEVHPWQGAFYMFASFKSESRRRGTAILRAETPLGPFVPWSDGPVTPAEWECLDGTFYASRGGQALHGLLPRMGAGGGRGDPGHAAAGGPEGRGGEPFLLFRASEAPWSREVRHSSGMTGYVTDGPFLWRGGGRQPALPVVRLFRGKAMPRGWRFRNRGDRRALYPAGAALHGGRGPRDAVPDPGRGTAPGPAQPQHPPAGAATVSPGEDGGEGLTAQKLY